MSSSSPLRKLSMQRIAGVIFAVAAGAALAELWRRSLPLWDEAGPGPAFFPTVLSVILVVLGAMLAARPGVSTPIGPTDVDDQPVAGRQTLKFTILLVGLVLAFQPLGGLPSLSLFVFLEMIWVERSSIVAAALSGIAAFALVWAVFVRLLAVPLPHGVLAPLLG